MFGLMNMLYLVQKSNIPWADNSLACSGWLNLKTWFLPKMTLEPVFNVIGWSNFLPFTKQMAPGLGRSFTTPELGMEKNVTLFYVILFLLPASMFFSTFLAFLALKLSLSRQVTTIYVYWDSSMPFASINPIFVEINLWKFLSENHYSYSPNHQITIYQFAIQKFTIQKSTIHKFAITFHFNEN